MYVFWRLLSEAVADLRKKNKTLKIVQNCIRGRIV